MDPLTLTTVVALSTLTSSTLVAAVAWFGRSLIEHWLTRALEERKGEMAEQLEGRKAELQSELTIERVTVEGQVRKAIETQLGDAAAQRQYESEARRRLYLAIGPLKFQLLLACRDFAGRVAAYGEHQRYEMSMQRYYGRSTLYRLLRPLALAELVERQIAYSDFAVDKGALDCLRFKRSAARILSGDSVILNHPKADWSREAQHAYADSVIVAANALIRPSASEPGVSRVLRFDEFSALINAEGPDAFDPFPGLITGFNLTSKPILWLRLVAYANACDAFVRREGKALKFETTTIPVLDLVRLADDPYVRKRALAFEKAIRAHEHMPL